MQGSNCKYIIMCNDVVIARCLFDTGAFAAAQAMSNTLSPNAVEVFYENALIAQYKNGERYM